MNNPVVFNGKILPADTACVSVFDPGFLYGESVFTTIAVIDHLPRFLPRHMDRLMTTAQKMGLKGLPEKSSVSESIHLLLEELPSPPALLRVTISPGTLSGYRLDGLKEGPCTWMVLPVFRSPLPDHLYKSGVSAEVGPVISPGSADPRSVHKTGNILLQRWIRQKMDKDLFESLFRNSRGLLLEGTICNLFWIMEDGQIMTPPESWGVLPGVVRAVVLEIIGEKKPLFPVGVPYGKLPSHGEVGVPDQQLCRDTAYRVDPGKSPDNPLRSRPSDIVPSVRRAASSKPPGKQVMKYSNPVATRWNPHLEWTEDVGTKASRKKPHLPAGKNTSRYGPGLK